MSETNPEVKSEVAETKPQGLYSKQNFEIAKMASKEENRYTLQAILVTPDETVVTDGHRMARVSTVNSGIILEHFPIVPGWETAPGQRFLFPADAALKVAKLMPVKQTIPILNYAAPLKIVQPIEGKTTAQSVGFVSTDLESPSAVQGGEPRGSVSPFWVFWA